MLDNHHIIHKAKYTFIIQPDQDVIPIMFVTKLVPFYILKIDIFTKEMISNSTIPYYFSPSNIIEAMSIISARSLDTHPDIRMLELSVKRQLLNTYSMSILNNINLAKSFKWRSNFYIDRSDFQYIDKDKNLIYIPKNKIFYENENYLNEYLYLLVILFLILSTDIAINNNIKKDNIHSINNITYYSIYKSIMLLPFIYRMVPNNPYILE